MIPRAPSEAHVAQAIDRAIKRLRNLHLYAGRPAWDAVVREELQSLFDTERQAREAAERERDEAHGGWATDREKFLDIESDLTQRAEAAEVSLAKAQARIAELEAALRPFASYFEQAAFDLDNLGNPLPDDQGVGWVYLTIGDFRRARSVLSSINKDAGHRALANTDGEPGR